MRLLTSDPSKVRAHKILDDVKGGVHRNWPDINWALRVLGEPVEESEAEWIRKGITWTVVSTDGMLKKVKEMKQ